MLFPALWPDMIVARFRMGQNTTTAYAAGRRYQLESRGIDACGVVPPQGRTYFANKAYRESFVGVGTLRGEVNVSRIGIELTDILIVADVVRPGQ